MALAITAHAQTENDYLRSLGRADGHLNRIWNERLGGMIDQNFAASCFGN